MHVAYLGLMQAVRSDDDEQSTFYRIKENMSR